MTGFQIIVAVADKELIGANKMKNTVEYIDKSGQKLVITTVGDELLITIGNHGNSVQIADNKLAEMVTHARPIENARHAYNYTPCN